MLHFSDKSDDKLPFACGCFWENSLRSITGQISQNKPLKTCLLLTSLLCGKTNYCVITLVQSVIVHACQRHVT